MIFKIWGCSSELPKWYTAAKKKQNQKKSEENRQTASETITRRTYFKMARKRMETSLWDSDHKRQISKAPWGTPINTTALRQPIHK